VGPEESLEVTLPTAPGSEEPPPLPAIRDKTLGLKETSVSEKFQNQLQVWMSMKESDLAAFIEMLRDSTAQADAPLENFRVPRRIMISITAVYALLCILVTALHDERSLVSKWIVVIEFCWSTPLPALSQPQSSPWLRG
jgi:hypothetical protein